MRMYRQQRIKARWLFAGAVIFFVCIILSIKTADMIVDMAQIQAKHKTLGIINRVVNEYITEAGDMYNNMLIKDKSADGNIFAVNTDVGKISRLQSEISVRINDEINRNSKMKVKLSITNILGFKAITHQGIGISASINPISGVIAKFEDSFVGCGINQTKFTLNLNIKADVRVLITPLRGAVTVDHTIPVAQIILLGDVPEQYTTIEGTGGIMVGQ